MFTANAMGCMHANFQILSVNFKTISNVVRRCNIIQYTAWEILV